MTRVDEINAQIAKLEAEREDAMLKERAHVLAKLKQDITLSGFKPSDFQGVLATRRTRGTATSSAPVAWGGRPAPVWPCRHATTLSLPWNAITSAARLKKMLWTHSMHCVRTWPGPGSLLHA